MLGRTSRRSITSGASLSLGRTRVAMLIGTGAVLFGGLFAVVAEAVTPPAYAATASLAPQLRYINDSAGSVYTFTVKNTGASASIGAVQIARPSNIWAVTSCPTPPAGWTAQASSTMCRFRSAASTSDDIKPGQTRVFNVKAKTAGSTTDQVGTWPVTVSKSNQFDNVSLLKTASPAGAGLTSTLYTFEVLDAVVTDTPVLPGGICPAPDKEAVLGSTTTIVVCGKNRATVALTPTAARSTLGGTFIASTGTFGSGPIVANSPTVVLGKWTGAQIVGTYGTSYKVIAGIGSAANRTSPLRTFTGYKATSQPPIANDDAYNATEDTQLVVNAASGVLANDSDPESDPMTATLVDDVDNGTLALAADGSFTYDPDPDFNGTDTFTYKANDPYGSSSAKTVTITVAGTPDAPTANDVTDSTDEDTAKSITLSGGDVDGDALTFAIVTDPAHGSLGPVVGSTVLYTPDADYHGPDSFTYESNDGGLDSAPATVTLTVNSVNDAPVAVADANSTDEDTLLTVTAPGVLGNDTDADADGLTAVLVSGPAHSQSFTLNADGSYSYNPVSNYNGPDSFTYKANDGQADSGTVTVSLTVNAVDDDPVAADDAASIPESASGTAVDVLANDTDGDSDTLTVTAIDTTGTTGTVTNNGSDVTYDPNGMFEYLGDGQTATDTFTYTVSDGGAPTDTATVTVTIIGTNDSPVAVDDSASTDEATSKLVNVVTNDTDAEGAITVTSVDTTGTAGTVTNNDDGTVTYNPNGAFESLENGEDDSDTFTYTVTDAQGKTDTATVTVTVNGVNDAPVAVDDAPSAPESSSGVTVNVLGNDTDAESQTLTVTAVDTTGTTGTVTNNGTDVTYDPNGMFESLGDNQTATDTFTYTVTDSQGGTDTATVTVTIDGTNDSPNAVDDSSSTDEATSKLVNVVANDTDAEGAITVTSVDTTGTAGTVTNNDDGTVTYNPNGAFESLENGEDDSDTFTYTVTDAQGKTDTATVTVTVNGINDAPVAVDDAAGAGENSTGGTVDVLGNDTDAESQTLTVTAVDTTGTSGTVTNNGTDVTYDPNGMFEYLDDTETATDTFTYTVTDSQGGTDTATVTITVSGANDAPVAADDGPFQAIQDQNLTLTAPGVLANDTDADGETLTAGNASDPANGTVVLSPDGSFSYTPDSGFTGTDTFTYDVSDGTATDTATVTINVVPPNATPTVDATSGSGNEDGGAMTVTLTGHDADGDALTFTAGTATNGLVTVPTSLSCDSNTPSLCTATVTYTPNADFNGSDSFTYTANDGTIDSAPATASITVNAVNDAPSFTKGGDQTVLEDAGAQTVTGWATAISAGPANESTQTVTFEVTGTTNDALFSVLPAVASNGDLTYTPAVNANGAATVSVRAKDDGLGTDTSPTQTFVITVTAVNDAPSFTKGADQTLFEDAGAQSVSGWATAISKGPADESAQTVSFTTSNDNNALFSVQPGVDPTGTLVYTSAPNAVGSATVTISISDTGGTANGGDDTSDSQTFTVTVNAVNDEPSLTHDGNQTVLEDAGAQTVNGFVNSTSAGPADESAQTVTVSVTGQTNAALFSALPSIDSAGTLTYTPAVNANGSSTVTIRATDNGGTANGGDDTGPNMTFDITVTPVNDVPSFTKGADQLLNEDAGAQSVSGWATAISEGPANEAAQDVTFTVTNDNNALFSSQPAVSPTGTLTYTSAPNQYGITTVTVSISDNGGTANGGDDTSDTQQFTIFVMAVNDQPVAAAKAYTVQANMKISLSGLLAGATDPNDVAGDPSWTPSFTLGSITVGAGCVGCTVSNVNNANGTFDFDPPAGQAGTFTATYTVVDNGHPAPGVASAAQTITFTVNGPVIHFVDTTAGAGGTGRLSAPFNNLPAATTAMGTDVNERIFVRGGNVSGNVVLPTDGWILSEAVTAPPGDDFDDVMGITPPAGTIARPSINGTQRNLSGSVTVGNNSRVRGFDLTPPASTPGLVGATKTNLTVNQMSITTSGARAVNLSDATGTFTLTRVTSTGSSDRGISLVNVNPAGGGSFTVLGTGTTGSGGTISGKSGDAVVFDNTQNVSIDRMAITGNLGNGVKATTVTAMSILNSQLTNNSDDIATNDEANLRMTNMGGTNTITNSTFTGAEVNNVFWSPSSGTSTMNVSGSTFGPNDATNGNSGWLLQSTGTANSTLSITGGTFTGNRGDSLRPSFTDTSTGNVTATGVTFSDSNSGVNFSASMSADLTYHVTNSTFLRHSSHALQMIVNNTTTSASAVRGTATGNTIGNGTADSGSRDANGISYDIEGNADVILNVSNNTIRNTDMQGVFIQGRLGSPTLDITYKDNSVQNIDDNSAFPFFTQYGTQIESRNTTVMCLNISGNTSTGIGGFEGFRVRQRDTATFKLERLTGAANDDANVASFVAGQNDAGSTAAVTHATTYTAVANGACRTTP